MDAACGQEAGCFEDSRSSRRNVYIGVRSEAQAFSGQGGTEGAIGSHIRKVSPKMNIIPAWVKDSDLAYIAGFIDADGCISFNAQVAASTFHGKSHSPRISGFSIDRHALDFIQSIFGGHISDSQGAGKTKRTHYRWSMSGDKAIWCARTLLPFLRIKKSQAQVLSDFDGGRLYLKRGNKKNKMPLEEFARRERLAAKSRYLNQRGYLEERPH